MKPVNFDYFSPTELSSALELLQQYGDEAKVLAGGQSLMPLMNMRLVRPKVIVDINQIPELSYIEETAEGGLSLGALTRQRTVERSALVQSSNPLLGAALPYLGHFQIRNRGTVGGSMVHADPAAELLALSIALEAEFVLTSTMGQRTIKAEEFFVGPLTTSIEPTELLTQVRVPAWLEGWGWGFLEVCRREGDFALAGAVALLQLGKAGECDSARVTIFGVNDTPTRMSRAEAMLLGRTATPTTIEDAARLVSEDLEPNSDLHAPAEYRKEVGGVVAKRALEDAYTRAMEGINL